ncbi:MAG: anti-sigma F factor antagonist [Clostridia bacterium]|nr:anti-sigma F factor antagonist [Oscillospiraceae bacterium]MBQ7960746.1 anti-sigma F factor antagonist [Clostridia bacterium]
MNIKLENIGTTLVAKLGGELDHHTAPKLRDTLDREIALNNTRNIVLDFDGVTFMDSSGIGVIIGRYKQIAALGGKVMIIRVKPQVDKILELSGLKKILDCSH